ncbi:hypothetical protein NYQ10_03735 [Flavobacterium johnsoniae]|uniref:hypothetical protein n=1 Tax=Flavobacterium johnsoniae TaxID=986 RepID=UPI0025B25F04|nr:hypothetical protein [Flavobacterium johnsoniae]WJS95567.1 hypothetical protein NYQ10_03735 [Flavobacterium johnsoniae]
MKKTALTFGLFSLVVLATSFSAPIDGGAAGGVIKKKDVYAILPIDGGAAGGVIKKRDVAMLPIDGGAAGGVIKKRDVAMNNRSLNFASVNQSIGNDKKVD